MAHPPKAGGPRLAYLDWMRGLAALIMLQGHVFHSLTAKPEQQGSVFVLSQFVGGIAPAVFLFLTGVTLAFMMDSRAKRGATPGERWRTALRRSGYFFGIAFLFRLQLWLFAAGQSPWTSLFKVDVLNCMGLAVLLLSPMALLDTPRRARVAAITGVAVAVVSPLISALDWSAVHPYVRAYFVPDYNYFSLFPWAAFLAFGLAGGSVLRLVPSADLPRLMQWSALVGMALWAVGRYVSDLPYPLYPKSDFWLDSPLLIVIKMGIVLMLLSLAFVWTRYINPARWSLLQQLGSTSLLVYWVHIELVYGRWFGGMKEAMPTAVAAIIALIVIAAMVLLSMAKTGNGNMRPLPILLKEKLGLAQALPAPAAGD